MSNIKDLLLEDDDDDEEEEEEEDVIDNDSSKIDHSTMVLENMINENNGKIDHSTMVLENMINENNNDNVHQLSPTTKEEAINQALKESAVKKFNIDILRNDDIRNIIIANNSIVNDDDDEDDEEEDDDDDDEEEEKTYTSEVEDTTEEIDHSVILNYFIQSITIEAQLDNNFQLKKLEEAGIQLKKLEQAGENFFDYRPYYPHTKGQHLNDTLSFTYRNPKVHVTITRGKKITFQMIADFANINDLLKRKPDQQQSNSSNNNETTKTTTSIENKEEKGNSFLYFNDEKDRLQIMQEVITVINDIVHSHSTENDGGTLDSICNTSTSANSKKKGKEVHRDIKILPESIQIMQFTCLTKLHSTIALERLYSDRPIQCSYEPEIFPGLNYYLKNDYRYIKFQQEHYASITDIGTKKNTIGDNENNPENTLRSFDINKIMMRSLSNASSTHHDNNNSDSLSRPLSPSNRSTTRKFDNHHYHRSHEKSYTPLERTTSTASGVGGVSGGSFFLSRMNSTMLSRNTSIVSHGSTSRYYPKKTYSTLQLPKEAKSKTPTVLIFRSGALILHGIDFKKLEDTLKILNCSLIKYVNEA